MTASWSRYMLTPVETTTRGLCRVEAGGCQLLQPGIARLEVDRHQPQPIGHAEAKLDQAPALPCLRSRPVDLEHAEARGDLGPALGEGVEPRAEDDVWPTPRSACSATRSSMKRARATIDARKAL